jgi:hypothetical protein
MDQRVRNKLISIFIVHGCRILIGKFWVLQVAVRVEFVGVLKDIVDDPFRKWPTLFGIFV